MPNMQTVFLNVGKFYEKLVAIFKQLLCFLTRRPSHERDIDDVPLQQQQPQHSYSPYSRPAGLLPSNKIAECRYSNPHSVTPNSWSEGWGDEGEDSSLKQVCVVSGNKPSYPSGGSGIRFHGNFQPIEEEEPNYFEELEPKISSNPKIVNKSNRTSYHSKSSKCLDSDRLYMSETVLAPDELQDWRDEDETGGGECGGWGDADSDALDDNVDAAEQSIREKRKRDMQLKIQRHQERNKRKQIEKQIHQQQNGSAVTNANSNTPHKLAYQAQSRH